MHYYKEKLKEKSSNGCNIIASLFLLICYIILFIFIIIGIFKLNNNAKSEPKSREGYIIEDPSTCYREDEFCYENYEPFLLEVNTNPGLEESSPLIKMLVPRMIDDAFRLTIDKMFENGKNNGNDYSNNLNKSKFSVDGYSDEENMWQKIKKI